MSKSVKRGVLIGLICIIALSGYLIANQAGVFQREVVLNEYTLAVEVEGQIYDTWPMNSSYAAMDKNGDDPQLYFRIQQNM